jgi:hypothetical protein
MLRLFNYFIYFSLSKFILDISSLINIVASYIMFNIYLGILFNIFKLRFTFMIPVSNYLIKVYYLESRENITLLVQPYLSSKYLYLSTLYLLLKLDKHL